MSLPATEPNHPMSHVHIHRSLARAALATIPKILTLMDRSPSSQTYGCFDRIYWHYRMMDFPCGMSQEFVLPLALVWSLDLPDNPYRGQPSIKEWVEAGIRFAAHAAHPDGSCDDYYPYERAAGAAAFSLFACLEAAKIIGLENDPEIEAFFALRARWLADHEESGRLSNHEALIVACLVRMAERDSNQWETAIQRRCARLLSWQHDEGWFDEYGGADPGYLSLTIGLLADIDRIRPDLGLQPACRRAIGFLGWLAHPDGTIGGEYTSRATRNYFPHGLEIAGRWLPEALALNTRLLAPLAEDREPCFSDDHIIGHHSWSWLLAWRDWLPERPAPVSPDSSIHFPGAQILVKANGDYRLYCGLTRGAAFKLFKGQTLIASDTGPSLVTTDGRIAVTHIPGNQEISCKEDEIIVRGAMAWAKSTRLTPLKSAVLRILMITVGRYHANLVRKLLQKLLVTGRKDAPFTFERHMLFKNEAWTITDHIVPDQGWSSVSQLFIGGYQTSVTTIMARVWQSDQLAPWIDLTDRLPDRATAEPFRFTRVLDEA